MIKGVQKKDGGTYIHIYRLLGPSVDERLSEILTWHQCETLESAIATEETVAFMCAVTSHM